MQDADDALMHYDVDDELLPYVYDADDVLMRYGHGV